MKNEPKNLTSGDCPDSIVDQKTLDYLFENLCDGDQATMQEMVKFFIQESESLLSQVQTAVIEANSHLLRHHAHSLKSSSASFGAIQVSQICQELENMGRDQHLTAVDDRAIALNQAFTRFRDFLTRKYLNDSP